MARKARDAFRTISEVAEWLDIPAHVLRFWESKFSQIKPVKRAGGRRYYRPTDMELIGGIKKLLHDDGVTIRGVQKLLKEEGVKHVAAFSPPLDGALDPDAADENRKARARRVEQSDAIQGAQARKSATDTSEQEEPDAVELIMGEDGIEDAMRPIPDISLPEPPADAPPQQEEPAEIEVALEAPIEAEAEAEAEADNIVQIHRPDNDEQHAQKPETEQPELVPETEEQEIAPSFDFGGSDLPPSEDIEAVEDLEEQSEPEATAMVAEAEDLTPDAPVSPDLPSDFDTADAPVEPEDESIHQDAAETDWSSEFAADAEEEVPDQEPETVSPADPEPQSTDAAEAPPEIEVVSESPAPDVEPEPEPDETPGPQADIPDDPTFDDIILSDVQKDRIAALAALRKHDGPQESDSEALAPLLARLEALHARLTSGAP